MLDFSKEHTNIGRFKKKLKLIKLMDVKLESIRALFVTVIRNLNHISNLPATKENLNKKFKILNQIMDIEKKYRFQIQYVDLVKVAKIAAEKFIDSCSEFLVITKSLKNFDVKQDCVDIVKVTTFNTALVNFFLGLRLFISGYENSLKFSNSFNKCFEKKTEFFSISGNLDLLSDFRFVLNKHRDLIEGNYIDYYNSFSFENKLATREQIFSSSTAFLSPIVSRTKINVKKFSHVLKVIFYSKLSLNSFFVLALQYARMCLHLFIASKFKPTEYLQNIDIVLEENTLLFVNSNNKTVIKHVIGDFDLTLGLNYLNVILCNEKDLTSLKLKCKYQSLKSMKSLVSKEIFNAFNLLLNNAGNLLKKNNNNMMEVLKKMALFKVKIIQNVNSILNIINFTPIQIQFIHDLLHKDTIKHIYFCQKDKSIVSYEQILKAWDKGDSVTHRCELKPEEIYILAKSIKKKMQDYYQAKRSQKQKIVSDKFFVNPKNKVNLIEGNETKAIKTRHKSQQTNFVSLEKAFVNPKIEKVEKNLGNTLTLKKEKIDISNNAESNKSMSFVIEKERGKNTLQLVNTDNNLKIVKNNNDVRKKVNFTNKKMLFKDECMENNVKDRTVKVQTNIKNKFIFKRKDFKTSPKISLPKKPTNFEDIDLQYIESLWVKDLDCFLKKSKIGILKQAKDFISAKTNQNLRKAYNYDVVISLLNKLECKQIGMSRSVHIKYESPCGFSLPICRQKHRTGLKSKFLCKISLDWAKLIAYHALKYHLIAINKSIINSDNALQKKQSRNKKTL